MKKISTKVKPLQTGGDGTAYYGEEVIKEKALSKKQQRFFGIVRAIQKGEQEPTTPETAKAAADMKKSDVKKYASTKHAKLPEKKIDEDNNFYNSAVDFSKIKNMPIKKPIKDFPKRDDEKFMQHTLAWCDDKNTKIRYREVHKSTLTNEVQYFPPQERVY